MNTILSDEYLRAQAFAFGDMDERWVRVRSVTLYDQFGRPVYVPSTAKKIGDTITVRRPTKFT